MDEYILLLLRKWNYFAIHGDCIQNERGVLRQSEKLVLMGSSYWNWLMLQPLTRLPSRIIHAIFEWAYRFERETVTSFLSWSSCDFPHLKQKRRKKNFYIRHPTRIKRSTVRSRGHTHTHTHTSLYISSKRLKPMVRFLNICSIPRRVKTIAARWRSSVAVYFSNIVYNIHTYIPIYTRR